MIAIIRVREDGASRHLCDLDLMKFTEDQVRQRMADRGIKDDAFFICGIRDWEVDRVLTLEEAYKLKNYVESLYDGDEYLISFMLKENRNLSTIFSTYYKFYSKDELAVMQKLHEKSNPVLLLEQFQKVVSWPAFLMSYHHAGHLLATPRGYYLSGSYF